MNEVKVIQTEQQYLDYLKEIHTLIVEMPQAGTSKSDRLELLTVLVESYENTKYPVEPPDPIDAILFRMQEMGLKQADLIPYFGTKSRVSEVLNRKRPLTVAMIRALSNGLGISTDTLVGNAIPDNHQPEKSNTDWSKFPIKEMEARGWIEKITGTRSREAIKNSVQQFISGTDWESELVAFRRNLSGEAYSPITTTSLLCWLKRVKQLAREKKTRLPQYQEGTLSGFFLREVAQLSWFEQGPKLAVEFLEKHGIAVVIESHLKGTKLDGVALKDEKMPIIGLTLRYDRLDNFWFTLFHELAHLWKHIDKDEIMLDDLDATSGDKREAEANRIAREALIPVITWKRSKAYLSPSRENIDALSRELKIHPAIIAGRIRQETQNYQQFSDLIGNGEVRKLFLSSTEA
jgi:HTH-type transcriptional regulator/antitoxin HigA